MPTLAENLRIRALLRSDLSRASAAVTPERPRSLLRAGAAIRSIRLPSGALIKPLAPAELSGLAPTLGPAVPHIIPFAHLHTVISARCTSSMGPFRGPGVVLDLWFRNVDGAGGDRLGLHLAFDSVANVEQTDIAGQPAFTGTKIFDRNERRSGAADVINEPERFIKFAHIAADTTPHYFPLNYPITLQRFFLTLVTDNGGTGASYNGVLRVLEGVNLDDWSPFL